MATITTNDLRIATAKSFIDSLNGPSPEVDAYTYMFIGRPTTWEDPFDSAVDDQNPPVFKNNINDYNKTNYQMLSLKRIFDNRAYNMIQKNIWTSGTIYDMYRHDYSTRNVSASGASSLYASKFYVLNSNFDVYVCLFNGTYPNTPGGIVSTIEPIGSSTDPFITSDGYQWLYLYSIPQSIRDFSANSLVPIYLPGAPAQPNGEINTIIINSRGTNYTSSPSGIANDIPYYFCNISGDGSGAVARVSIVSGSVDTIEIVRRGEGYTYATLDFRAGFVYKSLQDLDAKTNGLDPVGNANFISTCIISPPGGWGSDLPKQLGSTSVGIFGDISFSESDFIDDITFRQVGIIQNFEYSDIQFENNLTLSAHPAVVLQNSVTGNYEFLEQISQTVNVSGTNKIAKAIVIGWDSTTRVLRYIQDPELHTDIDGVMYRFDGVNPIVGSDSGASGSVSTSTSGLVATSGRVFDNGFSDPEIRKFTGDIVYVSNIQPVQRDPNQIEIIGVVINF